MRVIKLAAAWLVAAIIAALGVSFASSQVVVNKLIAVGAEVPLSQRASMTISDLAILQTLIPVMASCFLVGFIVATLCHRWLKGPRNVWFMVAGASSIVCTILLMSWFMNLMPIAGARTIGGQIAIALAGAVGGYVFARLSSPKSQ